MQVADEKSYEEVIGKLTAYTNKVFEACNTMYNAGKDCVDNTLQDPAAVTSNERLGSALNQVRDSVQTINAIIVALRRELEEIREAAAAASED